MKILFAVLALILISSSANAENWPRFRGPNGSGLALDANIPAEWTTENTRWKLDLTIDGHGSPVIWEDRIFLLGAHTPTPPATKKPGKKAKPPMPLDRVPMCLSTKDGSILWEHTIEAGAFNGHRFNSAGSSTAAVDDDQVVFTWATTAALTMASYSHDGELQWMTDLGPVVGGHGYGGSPILLGDLVILNNDQEKTNTGNLLAVDANTGEVRWTVPRISQRISYSVPCLYKGQLIFTNWQHGFTAIDPKTGEVTAELSVFDTETNERAISSPIVVGDLVIGTCGFTANPKHCVALRLTDAGEFEEVWRIERNVPHIPSLIAVGERLFLIDDAGIVTVVEAKTGEEIYKARTPEVEGSIFGSPVSDGEKIFFADESGNVHAISATGDALVVLARNRLDDLCRSTPAIVDGAIYVRTEKTLRAISN